MSTRPVFEHELIVDRSSFRAVMRGVVHTIAFFRMIGLLRPETQPVYDVDLPQISDPDAASEIDARCNVLADQLEHEGASRATLRISWFPPPAERTGATKSVFYSPYSWIASAFSNGLADKRDTLPEFERWIVHVRIGTSDGSAQVRDFYGAELLTSFCATVCQYAPGLHSSGNQHGSVPVSDAHRLVYRHRRLALGHTCHDTDQHRIDLGVVLLEVRVELGEVRHSDLRGSRGGIVLGEHAVAVEARVVHAQLPGVRL